MDSGIVIPVFGKEDVKKVKGRPEPLRVLHERFLTGFHVNLAVFPCIFLQR